MIDLPTDAATVCREVWRPAMTLLPDAMRSERAALIGLAIGGQETGYRTRVQMGGGPARSFWQFEKGGVRAVFRSEAALAASVCSGLGVLPAVESVHAALATNDLLGAVFARLLLWSDPHPLPADSAGAYQLYLRAWRPGKPDDARWPSAYEAAQHATSP